MGGLVISDEEGIAKSLWKKSRNESIFAIYTPYILSLASGKLDSGSFLHCISQDIRFLQASAEAFEMAEECADDDDDKNVIRKIRKRVLRKMSMFQSIVQEWGFELPAGISDRAMIKYTDFLLATASGKVAGERFPGMLATPFEKTKLAAYALAAMAPSMRIKSFFSKEIQAVLEPDENIHVYKKWIDSVDSQKFEVCLIIIAISLKNPRLLGLNVDHGAHVKLRLRRPNTDWDFYPFDEVLDTMLHELCHNATGPHTEQDWSLLYLSRICMICHILTYNRLVPAFV